MSDYVLANENLFKKVAAGDASARDQLIEQNMGLVHSVVRRFQGRGQETEDLFQVGCVGLVKAAKRFDCSYGVKFSTYAVPMIMGEIKRFLRDDGVLKVSRRLKEIAIKATALRQKIVVERGVEPTLTELAKQLAIDPAELATALDAGARPESLNAITDDGNKESRPLLERIDSGTDYEGQVVNRLVLRQLLSELGEREQRLLCLRYFRQKTQTEIARILGISQVQVSRIEKKLLAKMRQRLEEESY